MLCPESPLLSWSGLRYRLQLQLPEAQGCFPNFIFAPRVCPVLSCLKEHDEGQAQGHLIWGDKGPSVLPHLFLSWLQLANAAAWLKWLGELQEAAQMPTSPQLAAPGTAVRPGHRSGVLLRGDLFMVLFAELEKGSWARWLGVLQLTLSAPAFQTLSFPTSSQKTWQSQGPWRTTTPADSAFLLQGLTSPFPTPWLFPARLHLLLKALISSGQNKQSARGFQFAPPPATQRFLLLAGAGLGLRALQCRAAPPRTGPQAPLPASKPRTCVRALPVSQHQETLPQIARSAAVLLLLPTLAPPFPFLPSAPPSPMLSALATCSLLLCGPVSG